MLAARAGNLKHVEKLVRRRADPARANASGHTAEALAREAGHPAVAAWLRGAAT